MTHFVSVAQWLEGSLTAAMHAARTKTKASVMKHVVSGVACMAATTLSTFGMAEEVGFKLKGGFYVSAAYEQSSIKGEFDDTIFLNMITEVVDVPLVKDGSGWAAEVGGVAGENGSKFSIGYRTSDHDTSSVLLGRSQARFVSWDLRGQIALGSWERVRPLIILGLGLPTLTIENATILPGGRRKDARFRGYSFDIGAGVDLYAVGRWSIGANVVYRATTYSTANGESIDDGLSGSGTTYTLRTAFTF